MTQARFTPVVQALPEEPPFTAPEELERRRGAPYAARLGANENVFGPSPRAIEAMRAAAPDIWVYGEPSSFDLRHALAARLGVAPEAVTVGEGIDGLLGNLVRLVIAPGDPVVTSDGAYPTFNYHVAGFGGVLHTVPFAGDLEDPDALIAKAKEVNAKLVYLSNPGNPMGGVLPAARVQAMIDALPEGCLMVLDEAYIEFAPAGSAPAMVADPRVIRMRTFSKAYALAGARVGYAISDPALIAQFDKIRNHFGVNLIGQAGALASFEDEAWLAQIVEKVNAAKARIGEIAAESGCVALPSATNFVAIDCGGDGDLSRAILSGLDARGIFARMPFTAGHDRCIRVSVGTDAHLDLFAKAFPEALAEARG